MSPRRRVIKGIPRRHFDVKINRDVVDVMAALASSFEKKGFEANVESPGFGVFHNREGMVTIRLYEHFRNRPKATVWCYPNNENATRSDIEAFAKRVQQTIQAVPDVKVQQDDGLLYEKRYSIVKFPDDTFRWVESPGLWLEDYFKEPVISYIRCKMQIDIKNHRKFFETVLAVAPERRWADKNLDLLHHYHYSTIFWLAASRMNLDQLVELIGITGRKPTWLREGPFRFKLQLALGTFLTSMSSALDALAQTVNLMCLSKPKEEGLVTFKEVLKWIEDDSAKNFWKVDISQLRNIFLKSKGVYAPLISKCLKMTNYRNIVIHRRVMPLVNTVRGTYFVTGEAGRLIARAPDSMSSQSRSIAVHIPSLEADVDRGLATIAITASGRLFLPKIRGKDKLAKLVYEYPIDRSQFNREDVLLQFEKYYECVSSLTEKVYAALLDMQRYKD